MSFDQSVQFSSTNKLYFPPLPGTLRSFRMQFSFSVLAIFTTGRSEWNNEDLFTKLHFDVGVVFPHCFVQEEIFQKATDTRSSKFTLWFEEIYHESIHRGTLWWKGKLSRESVGRFFVNWKFQTYLFNSSRRTYWRVWFTYSWWFHTLTLRKLPTKVMSHTGKGKRGWKRFWGVFKKHWTMPTLEMSTFSIKILCLWHTWENKIWTKTKGLLLWPTHLILYQHCLSMQMKIWSTKLWWYWMQILIQLMDLKI